MQDRKGLLKALLIALLFLILASLYFKRESFESNSTTVNSNENVVQTFA
ncbi:hypothetical protein [Ligilactobacillus acidipiscis]|jgi:uncharacterized protein (UPF0333 family)|nr:hypothetical protein [Ligilactobacillus acidipiscis]GEN21226.1 hypothetical protein LAC02_45070 [Ligilactobacillus acidipiscis]